MTCIWDLEKGDRIKLGYGIWDWIGKVTHTERKTVSPRAQKYYSATVITESGRKFHLQAKVWNTPKTRHHPAEFSVKKHMIETSEGDKAILTRLKKIN